MSWIRALLYLFAGIAPIIAVFLLEAHEGGNWSRYDSWSFIVAMSMAVPILIALILPSFLAYVCVPALRPYKRVGVAVIVLFALWIFLLIGVIDVIESNSIPSFLAFALWGFTFIVSFGLISVFGIRLAEVYLKWLNKHTKL
jgi:hypothetical protein